MICVFSLVLQSNQVWIYEVLPPIVGNTSRSPGHFRQMTQPPLVMQTDIPTAPFICIHLPGWPGKPWKMQLIVTVTGDQARVIPIIVTFTVRRKVDVSHLSLPGILFIISRKTFIQVLAGGGVFKSLD